LVYNLQTYNKDADYASVMHHVLKHYQSKSNTTTQAQPKSCIFDEDK